MSRDPSDGVNPTLVFATIAPSVIDPLGDGVSPVTLHRFTLDEDDASEPAQAETSGQQGRYQDLGELGSGGMGTVRRVLDRDLNRTMAMKILRDDLMRKSAVLARFVEEAQATAQLHHPGIVPVHEIGTLPDGRMYFTMAEVRGRSLYALIDEVHAKGPPDGPGLRRLVQVFLQMCHTLAYAHERGVIHRDLKPSNIMLGEHGEVLVLDWGLAKIIGRHDELAALAAAMADNPGALKDSDAVLTDRYVTDVHRTRLGAIAGTPAYMSPEQARGDIGDLGPRSDVYALGALLFEMLSGVPAFDGPDVNTILMKVHLGEHGVLSESVPDALRSLAVQCLAMDAEDRPASADAVAQGVQAWLDGSIQREQALALVEQSETLRRDAEAMSERVQQLRAHAAEALRMVPANAAVAEKADAWKQEDEANALEHRIGQTDFQCEWRLHASLRIAPELAEAHEALVTRYRKAHVLAEAKGDVPAQVRFAALLEHHVPFLPSSTQAELRAYLQGDGVVTLVTEPANARILLYRYEERLRRLLPVPFMDWGKGPHPPRTLPMGSYLAVAEAEGHERTRIPFLVQRQGQHSGVRPGSGEAHTIRLPKHGELAADDCFIPGGWAVSGGYELYDVLGTRRIWVDPFVMKRFAVTNAEYIEFLQALEVAGQQELAEDLQPRLMGEPGKPGAPIYKRTDDGRYHLVPDAEGDLWLPEFPVLMVSYAGAVHYAAWRAETEGLPWRLPGELEWEKAGRGVDGRAYPWGAHHDATWCLMRLSHGEHWTPAVVDSYPVDESPYGVRGMAGNSMDWCGNVYSPHFGGEDAMMRAPQPELPMPAPRGTDHRRAARGGMWLGTVRGSLMESRNGYEPSQRFSFVGFRLARSV